MRTCAPLLLVLAILAPAEARGEATLTVLAAASLKAPLDKSAGEFERLHPGTHVVVSVAATGVLVKQLQAGAPADVIIGAAQTQLEPLVKDALIGPTTIIARNGLVVVAPAGSKLELSSLAGLESPGFKRIALGRPRLVPAGDYACEALARSGLYEKLTPRLVFAENVTQVATYVRSGDVDAGFVYASDARLSPGLRILLAVDSRLHTPIAYPAAVVARSPQKQLAQGYVEFLSSGAGQRALVDAGFLAP